MNKYYRDIVLIIIYGFCIVCQITFSSFLIYKKDDLSNILNKYKNIDVCKNDAIYRLNNGELINNAIAILISGVFIICSFLIISFNKILSKRNNYENLNGSVEQNGIISNKLITFEKFDMAIHIIFILAIICFVICNGIQFIFQLNNISKACLYYIDYRIDNFYTIYNFMTCIDFMSSYVLLFVIPCFI